MIENKVIYIAGPITGVADYKEKFFDAVKDLTFAGFIPLNPAWLPQGLTASQYMPIDLAMLDVADAVYLLPGSESSKGAVLERMYCSYIGKPVFTEISKMKEALLNGK